MAENGAVPDPPDGRDSVPEPVPAPEGVNLLGTPQRVRDDTDAARRRYAIGPFGQAWLWTMGITLTITGLYKLIAGPLLAKTLPTTDGTVLGWITIPARTITYAPRIAYEVGGKSYEFIAGSVVSTLTNAPKAVRVSYVPFEPSTALWNSGEWWASFTDVYLMVTLILGIMLFCVAIYQRRIRDYWVPKNPGAGVAGRRALIWVGILVAIAGYGWMLSGYLSPASWFIPPEPNAIAAFIAAVGTGLLGAGLHYRGVARRAKDARDA
ncbi:MAG: hypothetical protein ACTHON_19140 [Humibacter sp.]